jgi:hypothetical protein
MSIRLGEEKCNRAHFIESGADALKTAANADRGSGWCYPTGSGIERPITFFEGLCGPNIIFHFLADFTCNMIFSCYLKPIKSHCVVCEPYRVPLFEIVKPDRA